jgi:hypothetical protein
MRISNDRLSNGRSRAMVLAAIAVWLFLTAMFSFGDGTASAAGARVLGYEIYYYTDATFSFQCGYYNSCTKFRSGCFTPHQERSGIACGEG